MVLLGGCRKGYRSLSPAELPVAVALVPGCPSNPDGTLSICQWRRVLWAHHLYASGVVTRLVTSGNAVQTPHVEAEAMAAGLVALGVPAAAILQERRALHTDENVAYTLAMVVEAPWRSGGTPLMIATDRGQASGACAMVDHWRRAFPGIEGCISAPIDERWVWARLRQGLPEVRVEPVAGWVPLAEREAAIADETGRRRPPSFWVYTRGAILGAFGRGRPPG